MRNPITTAAPANPEFETTARAMFSGQPFMAHLGVELVAVHPGSAELRLPFHAALTQHNRYFHGGVIATMADMSGGTAAYTVIPADRGLLTVELKLNLLAPGLGEALIGRGRVVRAGRNMVVCAADIHAVQDGMESHCATQLMTLMVIERRD